MKYIELTQGKQALVDDEDYEELNQYKWFCFKQKTNFYAGRNSPWKKIGSRPMIRMHRFVTNAPNGKEVDHINGNGLDNQKSNLRICTRSQNQHNSVKRNGFWSKFKGICFHHGRWEVYISLEGKSKYIGSSKLEVTAATIYNEAAKKHFGEYAKLNVINQGV